MTTIERLTLTRSQLDNVAWQFLRSEFTAETYAHWPVERRLDAFLLHRGFRKLHDDGSAYGALFERVMTNLPTATKMGLHTALRSASAGTKVPPRPDQSL